MLNHLNINWKRVYRNTVEYCKYKIWIFGKIFERFSNKKNQGTRKGWKGTSSIETPNWYPQEKIGNGFFHLIAPNK